MSFEGDAPMRTLCPVCEKYVETEGYGIHPYVWHEGATYHVKCAPEFCQHENAIVMDWSSTDSDTVIYKMFCRDCRQFYDNEVIGSLVRAGDENESD